MGKVNEEFFDNKTKFSNPDMDFPDNYFDSLFKDNKFGVHKDMTVRKAMDKICEQIVKDLDE